MIYNAQNIDTEKALNALENSRRFQQQQEMTERAKTEAYYKGVYKGLEIAEDMFHCSNYEKPPVKIVDEDAVYAAAVDHVLCEICKELDINGQDIREAKLSIDQKCAMIADRARALYAAQEAGEGMGT